MPAFAYSVPAVHFFETFKVDRFETIGKYIYDLGDGQWDIPALRVLLMEVIPKSAAAINYEVEHDFPGLGRRTMLVSARTLHHPNNGSHTMLLSIEDATDRLDREATKDMLFGELRHRMKNLLAVAQSIARQTTTEGRSAEEYRYAFLGRFGALVQAQDLAFAEQDETALAAAVERILAPYAPNPEAVAIESGADDVLGPRTVPQLCSTRVGHERGQIWGTFSSRRPSAGQLGSRGRQPPPAQVGGEWRAAGRPARHHGLRL